MSNRRRPRQRRRLIEQAALELTRNLRGCTCTAEVIQRHHGTMTVASIHHERRCPARDAPHACGIVEGIR